jgi:uncharacterized membrane-anchored protein
MRSESTPPLGLRYWAAICAASVAGCNLGDFVSLYLHWGHWMGLGPLALMLLAIMFAEKNTRPTEAWYWAAILVVRTAATNIADLATHTFGLDYPWVIAALAVIQVLLVRSVAWAEADGRSGPYPKPNANGWYWASMVAAGAFGTANGDATAEALKLGTGVGTLVLGAALSIALCVGFATRWSKKAVYWFAIVAARSAGTTAGDWLAFSDNGRGAGLGLPASTTITCTVFIAILWFWRSSRHSISGGEPRDLTAT